MSYSHSRRQNRTRPRNAQQENIDKQISCLHRAMAEKLLENKEYQSKVNEVIERRYESGKMRHGCYLFWSSLMDHIDQPELFLTTLLEDTPQLRKYRRQTPFVGILTESERQNVLDRMTFEHLAN